MRDTQPVTAVVMSGGGARGAYQAGVCKAIGQIAKRQHIANPFSLYSGVSAGAINASFLASTADDFTFGSSQLATFWVSLTTDDVFRTDIASIGKIGLRWAWDILRGGHKRTSGVKALLDTSPLAALLTKRISFERITNNIEAGYIQGVAVTATEYQTSSSVSFFQAKATRMPALAWDYAQRLGRPVILGKEHVLASSALPLLFPPVGINDTFFGDGCLRNTAPLSAPLHLGANRLLIVGARKQRGQDQSQIGLQGHVTPGLARVLSVLLNAVLLDAIDTDLERLVRLNDTVKKLPETARALLPFREVEYLYIQPSEDIGKFAITQFDKLPKTLQHLIGGLGNNVEASELLSYLLFEPDFCGYLVNLGFQDAMSRQDEITAFLQPA